jgi:Xaa-Pro dipeptidase
LDQPVENLRAAQHQAEALFADVIARGLIKPGRLESEVSDEIFALAKDRFGVRRHWHKRIVRTGSNTLLTYDEDSNDLRIGADDTVFLDFGPVFDAWEADFGRTYALGNDPRKHQLVHDLAEAFRLGKELFERTPQLTTGELYDFVVSLAAPRGWEFGASTAGHPVGHFPHERPAGYGKRLSIRHGNDVSLREPDGKGGVRHWILEIHFIDRQRGFGGFYEELLTC